MTSKTSELQVQKFQTEVDGRVVSETTVRKTASKFKEQGTIPNRNKGLSGRRFTKKLPENIQRVRHQIEENGYFSCRRNGISISHSTVCRIIKIYLIYFPYETKVRQTFTENDIRRNMFCRWFTVRSGRFVDTLTLQMKWLFI